MRCRFCNQQVGFMKTYHEDCRLKVEGTVKQIEEIVNEHKEDDVVPEEVKKLLKKIANSNEIYINYMKSRAVDKTIIHVNETIIYAESNLVIHESKNRCKMVETGYRYEKMPTWSEKEFILDKSGTIIFTDVAVYLQVGSKMMRYPYKKIVNYGYEKVWTLQYAYFDVKTSSPYPHRFSFSDTFKAKDGRKEQNICLLIHVLIS